MIRSFLVITFALGVILFAGLPLLLYGWLSGNTDLVYRAGVSGAAATVKLAGVRLRVTGKEKIPLQDGVVFMANHQSNCDPPALVGLLPPVLLLAKEEFFRVPILGAAMRLRGFIPVDRKSREKSARAIERAVESISAGHSFLVFPEGTRSEDGRLQPFKKGVFIMAVKVGAPIIPISISGSRVIMPKGKAAMRPGEVRITFHQPVETQGNQPDQIAAIQDAVRRAILSGLAEDEKPAQAERDIA